MRCFSLNNNFLVLTIILVLIGLFAEKSYSADGRVWHIEDRNRDTIDFGVVFLGDSVPQKFLLQNYTNKTYKVLGKSPSYIIRSVLGGADFRYLHFLPKNNSNPIIDIKPNSVADTVTIYFRDKLNNDDAVGEMAAFMELGMVDESFSDTDPRHLIVADTFYLVGRKTDKLIAATKENIEFDSVYLNSKNPSITKTWNVRNVWRERLKIENDDYRLITSKFFDGEINVEKLDIPFELQERSNYFRYPITYTPKDLNIDSANYKMYYFNDINNGNPTRKLDSIVTVISGVGVRQDLRINSMDKGNNFSKSTRQNEPNTWIIEIGNININEDFDFKMILENPIITSNIPIGKSKENFNQKFNRTDKIDLIKSFISNGRYLLPGALDTLNFRLNLNTYGSFEIEYNLTTNLRNRKISNYQNEDENFKFIFKGFGVSGDISISKDTINFGAINIVGNCPLSITDSIKIKNRGTADLVLKFISGINFSGFDFDYGGISSLKPNEEMYLKITFMPSSEINYNSILNIIYNVGNKEDTLKIHLFGNGISRFITNLSLPELRYKPGSEIIVPIYTEGNKISLSSKFSSILRFDNTMMSYIGYKNTNTATNNLSLDSKITLKPNPEFDELEIKLNSPENQNFAKSDTLILLRFNTFLSDRLSSNLELFNPKIGNENCDEIMEINKTDGTVIIDSICGLEYKVFDRSKRQKFVLKNPNPNPIENSFELDFTVAFRTNVNIEIYNSYGEVVQQIISQELSEGNYSRVVDFSQFNTGVYLIRMKAGLFEKTHTFIKN